MSKNDAWMPLYVGDYLADTMHLSAAEHGAYLLLLMHSWRTGPLPDDDNRLAAIARTDRQAWKAMASVIRAFFTATDTGLVQLRLERVRDEQGAKIEQRRAAGKASAEARARQRNANERSTAVEIPLEREARELELELDKERKNPPTPRKRGAGCLEGFDRFWAEYPRKVGKGAAEKAWPKALAATGGDPDPIVFGLIVAKSLDRLDLREDMRFCPHPSTWLNEKRWLDGQEPEPEPDPQTSLLGVH